jgi:hypothetical protein
MPNRPFTLAYGLMLLLGVVSPTVAQDTWAKQPSARQQLQHIHTPQSIDQEGSPYERSGVEPGTAEAGPASA